MQKFVWKVLCLENKIAISMEQKLIEKNIPITEYFFWPQSDAWEELRIILESKKWISFSDRVYMLNILTDLLNFWDERGSFDQKSFSFLTEKFPNVIFVFLK
jgi:30S ribosomal protein 3